MNYAHSQIINVASRSTLPLFPSLGYDFLLLTHVVYFISIQNFQFFALAGPFFSRVVVYSLLTKIYNVDLAGLSSRLMCHLLQREKEILQTHKDFKMFEISDTQSKFQQTEIPKLHTHSI